jgi:hypothetical protein
MNFDILGRFINPLKKPGKAGRNIAELPFERADCDNNPTKGGCRVPNRFSIHF